MVQLPEREGAHAWRPHQNYSGSEGADVASNNDHGWWDNSHADFLGWKPKDNAADFAAEIARTVPRPGPDEPVAKYQGGVFTDEPIHES